MRPLKRVEHLIQPEPTPAIDPLRWTNRQCRDYARQIGLLYKDRLAVESYAKRLGLVVKPLAVAPALIKAIACYELAHGEL